MGGARPHAEKERTRVASLTPDLFCRPENGGTNQIAVDLDSELKPRGCLYNCYVTPLRLMLFMTRNSDYIMLYQNLT